MKLIAASLRTAAIAGLALVGFPGGAGAATPGTVDLTMSNFHYCASNTCSPLDQGYLRDSTGPVAGTDNPHGIIDVPEGSTVRWVYKDVGPGSCDSFEQCPGHNVRLEDGSADGTKVGFVKSRGGEEAITLTVTQPAGTLVHYFCSVNKHWQLGMTGILRIVPAH